MKRSIDGGRKATPWNLVLGAGLAGGVAEIVWLGLVGSRAPGGTGEVARQVTATVLPGGAALTFAPIVGVLIHLLLSVLLGFAFWRLVWLPFAGRLTPAKAALCGVGSLALVWVVNFAVVLPALNPAFATLLPIWVTMISKLLFGAAMTAVLLTSDHREERASRRNWRSNRRLLLRPPSG
jgi:hypothetical protein